MRWGKSAVGKGEVGKIFHIREEQFYPNEKGRMGKPGGGEGESVIMEEKVEGNIMKGKGGTYALMGGKGSRENLP